MQKLLAVTIAALSLAACAVDPEESESIAAVTHKTSVYVGDSIAFETNPVLQWVMASSSVSYASSTLGGMAICDFFPEVETSPGSFRMLQTPPPPNLRDLVVFMKPQVVVMQFWGNSWLYTSCMKVNGTPLAPGSQAYFDKYAADANRAMEIIRDAAREAGIAMPKVQWVLQGPDRGSATRTQTLNGIYTALHAQWPTASTIDAGREVSLAANYWSPGSRYGWSQWLPCTQLERDGGHCVNAYGGVAQIHKDNDDIHFCLGTTDAHGLCSVWSPGIFRYGLAITGAMSTALGL